MTYDDLQIQQTSTIVLVTEKES